MWCNIKHALLWRQEHYAAEALHCFFFNKMAETTLSNRAYCKLIMHAAKYPHASVNGVLLAEKRKLKENKILRFVDCVPLFHLSLGLVPMLEVSLLQVMWLWMASCCERCKVTYFRHFRNVINFYVLIKGKVSVSCHIFCNSLCHCQWNKIVSSLLIFLISPS